MSTESHPGRCFCGAVTYRVDGPLTGVIACHCKDCQQLHGAASALVVFDRAALTVEGAEHLVWYDTSAQSKRSFCRTCGSRLFKDKGGDKLIATVGTLDGPTGLRYLRHIWTESKGDWYDVPPVG